jgi:hypothetical protein
LKEVRAGDELISAGDTGLNEGDDDFIPSGETGLNCIVDEARTCCDMK